MTADLKRQIQFLANDHGFDACGFTNVLEPEHRDYFLSWLKAGQHADMRWMERGCDKRLNPRLLMEGATSAIVLLASYQHSANQSDYRLARYAWGRDYHLWLRQKADELALGIKKRFCPDLLYRVFVDTGPILERDLACKAGLGWIGKNTCLINPRFGSFVFIAVILTNLDLSADETIKDHCGRCDRCVSACPTQALKPYQLNASLCLAYHNIEKRGEREPVIRDKMGDRLVGCDLCQEVCPHNKSKPETNIVEWLATFDQYQLGSLGDLLSLSEHDYELKTRDSALSRLKYFDFMRNVFIVIANAARTDLLNEVCAWQLRHPTMLMSECVACAQKLGVK
ncbi:MAG: iron-sulfur cluster binding protein [uncultured bacterium]|nr:MAG: iron-sulfur cluster binding protein [uncultured bacterium]HLD44607.1 tRNA epoxyqueuosine(34) reductase QueG [bacterium]